MVDYIIIVVCIKVAITATFGQLVAISSCMQLYNYSMLVSRVVVLLLLIFIQDINVTGIVRRNPVSDDEDYTDISSSNGQDTLINNDSNSYCDDVYANYCDCCFNRELATLTIPQKKCHIIIASIQ